MSKVNTDSVGNIMKSKETAFKTTANLPAIDAVRSATIYNTLSIDKTTIPWAEVSQAAGLLSGAGGVASILTMMNSFVQVEQLKEINTKLSKVINLQFLTLAAIKALGIQIAQEIQNAFVTDVEGELRAYHSDFADMCGGLKDDATLPEDEDYRTRLITLYTQTKMLTRKLAEHGHGTYQSVFASMLIVDAMSKLLHIPFGERRAFFTHIRGISERFYSAYSEDIEAQTAVLHHIVDQEAREPRRHKDGWYIVGCSEAYFEEPHKDTCYYSISEKQAIVLVDGTLQTGYSGRCEWGKDKYRTSPEWMRIEARTDQPPPVSPARIKKLMAGISALRERWLDQKSILTRLTEFQNNVQSMTETADSLIALYT